ESSRRILSEVKVSILRGNEAEVSVLGGFGGTIRGVDSVGGHHDKDVLARETAKRLGCTVAVTGPVDYVSDGERLALVRNGHPMLRHVTGTGCMATSVVAAFAAVESDSVLAAASALGYYGYAAEQAAARSHGPGTFLAALFDCLFNMTPDQLAEGLKVEMQPGCRG
ncbi:MAG TPA: hydroxyethylthiazole kinase, partial [Firmicutes bacterium]|nr:hydroxyethylthiazole kinase [Bacillota bacterium]